MACCTGGMAEGAALPRGDTEDTEVSSAVVIVDTKRDVYNNISLIQVYRKRSDSGDSGPEERYRYWV